MDRSIGGLVLSLFFTASLVQAAPKQDPGGQCPHKLPGLPCVVNTEKSDEVKRLIAEELYVGAPRGEIEAFFERHRIGYSYNRFGNRYQAIIRDVSGEPLVDQAVSISVFLDDAGRFIGSEVVDTFTAP